MLYGRCIHLHNPTLLAAEIECISIAAKTRPIAMYWHAMNMFDGLRRGPHYFVAIIPIM
jgi:hypothetical protein